MFFTTTRTWTITQRLVSGPNSTVVVVYDRSTRRHFVLKQLPLQVNATDAHQELTVAHKLRTLPVQPHVIVYEEVGVYDQSLWLVMEHCAGGDLYSFVEHQPSQRLCESEALYLWRQVVRGVQFLHEKGIAHRDLSLENVLLDKDQRVAKICDFGLSTCITQGEPSSGRVGKSYYMAPEVAAGETYDAVRADIWSLGVMLFILLTGSPLVQAAVPSDPVYQALERVGVRGILKHWRMDTLLSTHTIELLEGLLQISPRTRIPDTQTVLELQK